MGVKKGYITHLLIPFLGFFILSCGSSNQCRLGEEYAFNLKSQVLEDYQLVNFWKQQSSAKDTTKFTKCFVESYGEDGIRILERIKSAAASEQYESGVRLGTAFHNGELEESGLIRFLADSIGSEETLAFEAGFVSVAGDQNHDVLENILILLESSVFTEGRNYGSGFVDMGSGTYLYDVVTYIKEIDGAKEKNAFALGFRIGYGVEGERIVETLVNAAMASEFDDGVTIGFKFKNFEMQPWELANYVAQNVAMLSIAKRWAFKVGFMRGYGDPEEAENVLTAIGMAINVGRAKPPGKE